jgi:hypothetical protein
MFKGFPSQQTESSDGDTKLLCKLCKFCIMQTEYQSIAMYKARDGVFKLDVSRSTGEGRDAVTCMHGVMRPWVWRTAAARNIQLSVDEGLDAGFTRRPDLWEP